MRCCQAHPHLAPLIRADQPAETFKKKKKKDQSRKRQTGRRRAIKARSIKTERYLPFCSAHLRAIIIESRFQTDKRSRKRDRASAALLTRREREGNTARGIQRTLIIRGMERVQRRGAMDRSTKGGEEGVDDDGPREVGEGSGAGIARGRSGSMTLITITLVVFPFSMWISKSKANVPYHSFRTVTRHRPLHPLHSSSPHSPPLPLYARSSENARAKFCSRSGAYGAALSAVR